MTPPLPVSREDKRKEALVPLPRKKSEEKVVEKPRKETPVKERKPPPEYAVKVAARPYVTLNRDYMDVMLRYTRLYVSADFAKVVSVWSQVCICTCQKTMLSKMVRERATQADKNFYTQEWPLRVSMQFVAPETKGSTAVCPASQFSAIWGPPLDPVTATRAFPTICGRHCSGIPHLAAAWGAASGPWITLFILSMMWTTRSALPFKCRKKPLAAPRRSSTTSG